MEEPPLTLHILALGPPEVRPGEPSVHTHTPNPKDDIILINPQSNRSPLSLLEFCATKSPG